MPSLACARPGAAAAAVGAADVPKERKFGQPCCGVSVDEEPLEIPASEGEEAG